MRDYDYEMGLKLQIEAYWRAHGYEPRVFIDTKKDNNEGNIYCIRSDMLGGKPIGARTLVVTITNSQSVIQTQQFFRRGKTQGVRRTYRTT